MRKTTVSRITPASTSRCPMPPTELPDGISTNASSPANPLYGSFNRPHVRTARPSPMPATTTSATTKRKYLRTRVQIVLQDHGRGCGVQPPLACLPVSFVDCEPALGFMAREALVLKINGHAGASTERPYKLHHARRHLVVGSVEPTR